MKIQQLIYFLETAKQEHIGRAAKALAISPSAISHGIASLEEELGQRLFVRLGKNIRLTNHGKFLEGRVVTLIEEIERIREEMSADSVGYQGTYRVASSHVLSSLVVAPVWARLQNENPRLTGELITVRSAQVIDGVISGQYDLGFCFSPYSHPYVERKVVYEGELHVVVRKGHSLARKKRPLELTDLSSFLAVLPKAHQGIENCESHPMFEGAGLRPKVTMTFDSYDVAMAKLRESDCWGLVPDWIARVGDLRSLSFPNWNAPMTVCAVSTRSRSLPKVLERVSDLVQEELKDFESATRH